MMIKSNKGWKIDQKSFKVTKGIGMLLKIEKKFNFQIITSCALTILLSIIFSTVSYAQRPIDKYIKIAAENNPELKATYTEFEAVLKRVAQVGVIDDPRLSFGYFISPIETRVGPQRAKISLTQVLPWFGTLKAKESLAKYSAEAKYQSFINEKNQLTWKVNKAYYPIYEIEKQLKLLNDNLTILTTYKRLAKSAFENNKGSLADIIRVDILIENAETELMILQNEIVPLQIYFNRLLNRSDSIPILIEDSIDITAIKKNYRKDSLLVNNPRIESLTLQQKAFYENEVLARKNGLPQFGVGLDYAFIGKRKDVTMPDNGKDAFMPMVSVSVPIFRKKYKAAIQESQLSQKAIGYRKVAIENELISNYEVAAFQVQKSSDLIVLYDSQINKTHQLIQLLYSSYSNSNEDFEEVLRMEQQLLKFEMAKITAQKNYQVSLAEIEYLTAGD
jgi:outer membrane protein TolC